MEWAQIGYIVLSAAFAAGGAYAAVRVHLHYHWIEIQRAHARLDHLEGRSSHGSLAPG